VILPRERPGAHYNYHLFPVLLRNHTERAAVRAAMWKGFVDTSTLYSGVVEVCRKFGYRGGCPVAESVADRLITLPNYAGLSEADIDTVARVFLATLTEYRNTRPPSPASTFGVRHPAREKEPSRSLLSRLRLENSPEPRQ
jgi:dTDP-4-amino-4,6-dideoxygalactose transaminase